VLSLAAGLQRYLLTNGEPRKCPQACSPIPSLKLMPHNLGPSGEPNHGQTKSLLITYHALYQSTLVPRSIHASAVKGGLAVTSSLGSWTIRTACFFARVTAL
jgi:hypothetical protein